MEIWHNPRCSKSRAAVAELDASGTEYTLRRYLDDPPSRDELAQVVERLGVEPWQIVRTADARALELTLPARDAGQREAWLALMATHPRIIQRPILLASDGSAVVGRDADSLARIID